MIDKYWVKFSELDIECLCKDRKCGKVEGCKEHVIKLTEIEREVQDLKDSFEELEISSKKLSDQLKRSIEKTKGIKL